MEGAGIEAITLPPRTPNMNADAERWIRSVKTERLDQLILFGQRSLTYVLKEYLAHHQHDRNHQGLDNLIPVPDQRRAQKEGRITNSQRLGGLFQFTTAKRPDGSLSQGS